MKVNINDIDTLESLPLRESRKDYITRIYGDFWNLHRFDSPNYNSERSKDPYIITFFIIKRFIGKPFDKVFSYLCRRVEPQYRYHFLDEFEADKRNYIWANKYMVDDNGNIQLNPEYVAKPWKRSNPKTSYTFHSFDYKRAYLNIKTGEISDHAPYFKWEEHHWRLQDVAGFTKEFESCKTKDYVRTRKEDLKRKNLVLRARKKTAREKAYSYLTKEEEKLIIQRKEDLIKRDAHGFDEKSFKGAAYHGQKRKLKVA